MGPGSAADPGADRQYSSVLRSSNRNAGLPKQKDGETYYDVSPEEFASVMRHVVDLGAVVIGGCYGTTPAHIAEMVKQCQRHSGS